MMAVTTAAPAMDGAGRGWRSPNLLSPGAALAAWSALGMPLLLQAAGLAAVNRLAYPALALAVGGFLYAKRSPWYVGFCIWLFCACALVRRMVDFQAGFQPSSTVLLAPYLACLFASGSTLRYLGTGRNPGSLAFTLILGSIFHAAVLAVLNARMTLGLVDALKWSVGPLMAIHILTLAPRDAAALRRAAATALLVAAPLMAVYGTLQFINPLPWDAEWLVNIRQMGVDSFGLPEPFAVRVFGPMQGPGSLAAYLMVGILLSVGRDLRIAVPVVLTGVLCLALCQYRTIWATTTLGLLLVALWGTARLRLRIALGAAIVVLNIGTLAVIPEMQRVLERRFNTLSQLSTDASGSERLGQYATFLDDVREPFLGVGFGLNYQAAIGGQRSAPVDSGILDALRNFGLFGGLAYLGGLAALLARLRHAAADTAIEAQIFRAAAVVCFIPLPVSLVLSAEAGFLGWLALGAALPMIPRRSSGWPPAATGALAHAGKGGLYR